MIDDVKQKSLHGRYFRELHQSHVDFDASIAWLRECEKEGFIFAIQDQIINTKIYKKYILKDSTLKNDLCRCCHSESETTQHILNACTVLANNDYKNRHGQVAKVIYSQLVLKYNLISNYVESIKNSTPNVHENENLKFIGIVLFILVHLLNIIGLILL